MRVCAYVYVMLHHVMSPTDEPVVPQCRREPDCHDSVYYVNVCKKDVPAECESEEDEEEEEDVCSEPSYELCCPPRPRRRSRPKRLCVSSRDVVNDACRSYLKCPRKPEPSRTSRSRQSSHYTPGIHSYTPSQQESYFTKSFAPSDGASRDNVRYPTASRESTRSSHALIASRPHTSSAHAPYAQPSRDQRSFASFGRGSSQIARASRDSECVTPRTRESRWRREPEEDPCCDEEDDDDDDECCELYECEPCPPPRTLRCEPARSEPARCEPVRCEPVPECPPEECYTVREVCRPARVCRVPSRSRRSARKRAPVDCCEDEEEICFRKRRRH